MKKHGLTAGPPSSSPAGTTPPPCLQTHAQGTLLKVKVVPGASRSKIAGLLGDRLKIQIAAPPEAGKANAAVQELLAETCGIAPRQIVLVDGATQPRKTLLLMNCSTTQVARSLGL